MSRLIVVGAQWGDEGKGKVVDLLSERFDIVARYQGGHNAGHTVEIGERKFILQLVPSGILRPEKMAIIGNGAVVDPAALLKEIELLEQNDVSVWGRLFLSNRAHLILPYHGLLEKETENSPFQQKIGTTSRGIGPAYADKSARRGLRVGDLLDEDHFRCLIEMGVREKQAAMRARGSDLELEPRQLADEYLAMGQRLRPLITDTSALLNAEMDAGRSVLFEGAQGTMLDVDHGTYPYVTSSNATSGGACAGLGIPPTRIEGIAGVSKAYTTRVGNGPFPSEDKGETGELLRSHGQEFGAVTGRPRRCGWMDLPVLRYSSTLNGLDSVIITKLDVLDDLDEIPVCIGYELGGQRLEEFPSMSETLEKVRPLYRTFPGWKQSTFGLTEYADLPKEAREYLEFIQDEIGVEISVVSTGPKRDQSIVLPGTRLEQLLPTPHVHS